VSADIETPVRDDRVVAIVGCGLIGASWAALLSAHGYVVRLWDPAPGFAARTLEQIAAATAQLSELGVRGSGPVQYASSVADAVRDSFWIQESTPESLEVKQQVFRELSECARSTAVIASSTSSFTWSQLAPFVHGPERLITAHPFNPPHLMPLVEIYAPTAPLGLAAAAFYRSIGRRPIVLRRDAIGHVANRLASALWREAVHIVAEGIAGVAEVDTAIVEGPGLRWSAIGPHMAYHLGGGSSGIRGYLAHLGSSQTRRWADLGSPTLSQDVCETLADGVDREAAGRSIDRLSKERDELLVATLLAREAVRRDAR